MESNSVIAVMSAARPLFHRKRRSTRDLAMSHKCHNRTHALQHSSTVARHPTPEHAASALSFAFPLSAGVARIQSRRPLLRVSDRGTRCPLIEVKQPIGRRRATEAIELAGISTLPRRPDDTCNESARPGQLNASDHADHQLHDFLIGQLLAAQRSPREEVDGMPDSHTKQPVSRTVTGPGPREHLADAVTMLHAMGALICAR